MIVTNVTARWTRRLPREQYGHAEVELAAQAILAEGESLEESANQLLGTLKAGVSAQLGIGIDKKETAVYRETSADATAIKNPPASPTTAEQASSQETGSERASSTEPASESVETEATNETSSATEGEGESDAGESESVEPSDWTPSDLHSWMMTLVREKKLAAPPMLEVLQNIGGVVRTKDLPQEKVQEVREAIENLLNG